MAIEKMDISKVLAMLAQPKEAPPPLKNVERRIIEIPYITNNHAVEKRGIRVFIPERAARPMPLVYVPHYEILEDSIELRAYLNNGWAVASAHPFLDEYNGKLTNDDLVFNSAALYALRRVKEIDNKRIALVGGSAGGYTTLMLNGLHLGLCASIANGPIANMYFNFKHYFNKAQALNMKALADLGADASAEDDEQNPALRILKSVMKLPIPFIAALSTIFSPNVNLFADDDTELWEAVTGVGVAHRFSSPVMVNHATSDVLVPVDQITRRFTYQKPGASLPEDFDMRLPEGLTGRLGMALDECLPPEDTRIERIIVPEIAPESVLPFDADKHFNINIYDDGPVEGYGTHSSRIDIGHRDDIPYLAEMFKRTADKTCKPTAAMLKELLLRYQGRSAILPARAGVDENAYGSLTIYKNEVIDELSACAHALGEAFEAVLREEEDDMEREMLKSSMNEIIARI